jgi:hypothetical protein
MAVGKLLFLKEQIKDIIIIMQNYTYKLPKMAKLVFWGLLLLPAWREGHVG